ncbi:MAG: lanthionine synthetase LanC family protein [Chloroflexia bacterium]
MSTYTALVEAVARAVEFHSPTTFSWFGKMSPQIAPEVRSSLTPRSARDFLLYNLQGQLYDDFYSRGGPVPSRSAFVQGSQPGINPFIERLSEANSGEGYWAAGWEVLRVEGDILFVGKDDLELGARAEDCLPVNGSLAPGARVSLRFSKELLGMSPGFYMAVGDTDFPPGSRGLVRFYWHLSPDGAVQLVHQVTRALNGARLPFRVKALSDTGMYNRCDAAVLYVRQQDYTPVALLVRDIHANVYPSIREGVPAFTRQLAPGLGFAEDPGSEESFGQHRCRLVAEGLLRAHEVGKSGIPERVDMVEERFTEAGISLDRPYLNPGSPGDYEFQQASPPMGAARAYPNGSARSEPQDGAEGFLRAAQTIGAHLAMEAIWYDGQCNWVGAEPEQESGAGSFSLAYKALGPGLYGGTAGIALFLAQLSAVTGDENARRTALGAIRQALAHAGVIDPITRLGLYVGWPGIALVSAHIGLLLGDEELVSEAHHLVDRCLEESGQEHDFDLAFGKAGAITASLLLAEMLDKPALNHFSERLAHELLESANKTKAGYSWKPLSFRQSRNLTGFSHGTAGVAHALLELYRATGDEQYRQAAEEAFAYERSLFDPLEGNWPDLRDDLGANRRGKRHRRFMTAWCHGAPGIALSRLRAYEMLGDEVYKTEALTALATTYKDLQATLASGLGNYSLCHGMAGNAEILRYGEQVLGRDWREGPDIALEVAQRGITAHGSDPRSWPGGFQSGESPSLMVGLAGTGYFYLRLCNPTTPSVLLFGPETLPRAKSAVALPGTGTHLTG